MKNLKNNEGVLLYQDTVGSLCMDDYKGPNRQYVEQEKLIIEVHGDDCRSSYSEDN